MIVLDASAAIASLAGRHPDQRLNTRIAGARSLHAPHLLDTEVASALRGLVLGRHLTAARAEAALNDLAALPLIRYSAFPLDRRVWSLRRNFTAYDATYLALAEALEMPVVTCDRKLASRRHGASVEVYQM
ncbi:hypothetical protein ASG90_06740 [Nocardioides sp. Soil797]|nr:hypothetical protein ASG90_06740 [Nocardioides sp. Soil797]